MLSGTFTKIHTNANGQFMYLFFALGASLRGFGQLRKVISVDATHLANRYKGILYTVVGHDANEQLYPVAYGVADSENNDACTWFFQCLKEAFRDYDYGDISFVTDRHNTFFSVIPQVFPNSYHGICIKHFQSNIEARFGKRNELIPIEFFAAAKSYTARNFEYHMNAIKRAGVEEYNYIMDVPLHMWTRSHFHGWTDRESRQWPIITMLNFILKRTAEWFFDRRKESMKCTTRVAPEQEKKLIRRENTSRSWNGYQVGFHQFEIAREDDYATVDMEMKHCSCGKFSLNQMPCRHAMAVCRISSRNPYSYCCYEYTTEAWCKSYEEVIWPVGSKDFYDCPEDIVNHRVLPPDVTISAGRRRVNRIPSSGEVVRQRKCSKCHATGHNRRNCRM